MCLGELCTVVFPLREDPNQVFVAGRAMRCWHVRGLLQEVDIRFDQPIPEPDLQRLLEQGRELPRPSTAPTGVPAGALAWWRDGPYHTGHDPPGCRPASGRLGDLGLPLLPASDVYRNMVTIPVRNSRTCL